MRSPQVELFEVSEITGIEEEGDMDFGVNGDDEGGEAVERRLIRK